jgi:peptidoglycan DL-endopeptidase CwlO
MLVCARRAAVVLSTFIAALSLLAPATSAEPRNDVQRPLPTSHVTSPVTGTNLSLSPHHKTIKYRHTIRLASRLTGKFGPVKNEAVSWWTRRPHGTWHRLKTVKTNKHGRTTAKRKLGHTTQFQVRYAGDLLQNKATSKVATVKVLPPPPPTPSAPASAAFGERVVQEAARHKGAPYQYGAAGPDRFDCSGFTMYVLGRFGVSLSHNASSQYGQTHHMSHAAKRPGDLIFFYDSSGIYHVGIYAGGGRMWAATHSGDVVRYESIYSASYLVGRVA